MSEFKALVICLNNANINPRPNRMIRCLQSNCKVAVACDGGFNDPSVNSIAIKRSRDSLWRKLEYLLLNLLGKYESVLKSKNYSALVENLQNNEYELIVTHDLVFLPLLKKYKKQAKIIFDAREYYPRQYEDKFLWRLFYKNMFDYLCKNYLTLPDASITVSKGIAKEYEKVYGVKFDILFSWPDYHQLSPSPVNETKIRILHHGNAFPSRKIEKMIELMDFVDDRYELDLMLVNKNQRYYEKLRKMVSSRNNVSIVKPVDFDNIIKYSNQYDIGLYLTEPGSFNIRHMLPNKFFEFIQSRLAIAIGPSIEMKPFVDEQKLGLVADDFSPSSLAQLLNNTTAEQIRDFKSNSHKFASVCNSTANCEKIKRIVSGLLLAS